MDELLGSVLQGLPSNAETATVAEQALNAALPDEELHEATVSDIVAAISILKRDMPKVSHCKACSRAQWREAARHRCIEEYFFPTQKLRDGGAPAIATRNQVWSIVKGDTGALRELDRLLQDGSVVSVTLPGYGNALMTREDFSSTIQRAKEVGAGEGPRSPCHSPIMRLLQCNSMLPMVHLSDIAWHP